MKILFINLPYSGHVLPTLGLVQALIRKGHDVTYLLTSEWQERVEDSGAEFVPYNSHSRLSGQIKNAYAKGVEMSDGFDAIIYEHLFFIGKHLGEKVNRPTIRIFTTVAANQKLIEKYVNSGGMMGIFKWKWLCRKWTQKAANGVELMTDNWLDEIALNPPGLNLVYTVREFQKYEEEFDDAIYKFIGTSIYPRKDKSDIQLEDVKKPIIYISMGTVFNNKMKFYKQCIKAFGDKQVTVIMSVGKKVRLEHLGKIPENFMVRAFVPQLEVLKHADVFVTHGGMNSINEALYYGVPMVVIPSMTDQPSNAERVEELKLGKRLEHKSITVDELEEVTMSVLSDSTIMSNVQEIQKKVLNAGNNEFGAKLIESYILQYPEKDM